MEKSVVDWIALVLVIIGGLNWGLWGAFKFNLVSAVFSAVGWLESLIYILVGISALYMIYMATKK
ncbi:MAG: DUF378 domain-containing protein [Candidatus Woesearchaeota archaeon]